DAENRRPVGQGQQRCAVGDEAICVADRGRQGVAALQMLKERDAHQMAVDVDSHHGSLVLAPNQAVTAAGIRLSTSSTLATSAKPNGMTAQAVRCSSSALAAPSGHR